MARRAKKGGGTAAPNQNGSPDEDTDSPDSCRIDKWLFYTRFFKTRSLATEMITKGRLRINGQRQPKPGHAVRPGDTLTFPMAKETRVIRVGSIATRRGPAAEAQSHYTDLAPPPDATLSPLE
ncbi:heat shock protein Hsp15 [Pseudorhodobacter antarcticus]|uniref:Heat shock protein Hsp15 n=1 Tax=Pseudorhodobacter antarcticus TaxID=1077947 RepID=A0A1H8GLS0_9RHOB|nr:RNA-binding S4 domain-containing protein [Pseudorhodobacter antarcticus]SEN44725.1 heat shock protein Hsp15 [Pseudorhodobacter antarcticus]